MRSSKSRSRNKSNRQRSLGNIVNRVFESSGPEGKVRGTPQQIIEKYLSLARDAQLSNDRVAEQSFLQHAEHYTRLLGEAQREMAERQQQHGGNPNQRQGSGDDRDSGDRDGSDRDGNGRDGNGRDGNGGRGDGASRDQGQQRDSSRDRAGRGPHDHDTAPASPQARPANPADRDPADSESEAAADDAERSKSVRPARRARSRRTADVADKPRDNSATEGLPDAVAASEDETGPVDTPETRPARKSAPRAASTRSRRKPVADIEAPNTDEAPKSGGSGSAGESEPG